ncbi:MAG TPA: cell division protein ZipA [Oleiagrimonas sp.]|nr:cell division protein ZipA [Oleiagrimonas sp.]
MHWNPAVGVPLLIIGLIVLALIWLFGQPRKPGQGKRMRFSHRGERKEPVLDGDAESDEALPEAEIIAPDAPHQGELDMGMRKELERLGATLAGDHAGKSDAETSSASSTQAQRTKADETVTPTPEVAAPPAPKPAPAPTLGKRPAGHPVERIVSLFVVAREGQMFQGADLVVAMEKAGLEFGAMNIFHRLLDGKPEQGAVFSVANMVKPGSFDMSALDSMQTPGLSFFMTLPGPLSALDAWDTMLPTAQRLAKLLEGLVLDEERNALGRQRVAHIRDELRSWDRRHEV